MRLRPQIYRQAAEEVFKCHQYCCLAIEAVGKRYVERKEFEDVFEPHDFRENNNRIIKYSFGYFGRLHNKPRNKNARVIALLLMEQIAKDL